MSTPPALLSPCATVEELRAWVMHYLKLSVPMHPVCEHHNAPMDYLRLAYFEPSPDLIVWAPRGGGKTRLAAAATLLDLLHKPGIQVRILGGSLDQSMRLWDHLLPDLEQYGQIISRTRTRRAVLDNDSQAAALAQSQRSIRGQRVQKLRCDEVELFDPSVWDAAQFVTRSGPRSPQTGRLVRGSIEALSTMHEPAGLMERIIDDAKQSGKTLLHWCVLDVLERCPPERDCNGCELFEDCGGIAKERCEGFFTIDDAISIKRRVSLPLWQAEMLCQRPSARNAVFPMFDPAVHVREATPSGATITLAMDFGFQKAFACLWIAHDGKQVHVIDEHVASRRMLHEHLAVIESRPWRFDKWVACDPAGNAPNDQTARSNVELLRAEGYSVRTRHSLIQDGIEAIRVRLQPAAGEPTLFIHPRCVKLIKALRAYRYGPHSGETPIKDGIHDHPIDALRYWLINHNKYRAIARLY